MLDVLTPVPYNLRELNKIVNPVMTPEDLAKVHAAKLTPFHPLYDFNAPAKSLDTDEPWLGLNLDVTKIQDAEKLVKILQRYVYQGWFEKDQSPDKSDYNNHFRENPYRTWCQTPWLNVTEKGREAIHGLTKEFPLTSSPAFKVPEEIDKNGLAYSWGLAFYNRRFCEVYDQFFRPRNTLSFQDSEGKLAEQIRNHSINIKAKDGSVNFKLLFSAMQDWREQMKDQWQGAYNWDAHVSTNHKVIPGSAELDQSRRSIMNIPHIQMDVGFKDSRIAGTRDELNYWVMMTFYYDPTYSGNELLNDLNIPEPLKYMRPVGLQYGINAGESHIFPGAKNNHRPNGVELPYTATRLNGPIDSSPTSCMGCHSQSGISFGLYPQADGKAVFAPWFGFLTQQDYDHFLSPEMGTGVSFDFNMQLDEAMKNFAKAKANRIFPASHK